MESAFLGEAYASRSAVLSSQTAINIYPELLKPGSPDIGGFYGCPGRKSVFTGVGQVRGLWNAEGNYYAVVGNTVYQFSSSFVATTLGTLPNSLGLVSMVDNGTQVAIAHNDGWHFITIATGALAAVTGAPTGTSILTTQDLYVMYATTNGQWGVTALADLSTIDPTDVATAEGAPDNLVSIASLHREVWLFGTQTIEVWDNTGAAFFPFQISGGGFIEQGCVAKFSVAKLDNSMFWLGSDSTGDSIVYRSYGYLPVRISTHPVEEAFRTYSTTADAFAYAYQEEGHLFYVLTFPTGDATWVYDVASKMWHQRAYQDADGFLHRDRVNCHITTARGHYVGDFSNGKIYQQSTAFSDDDGNRVYRERAWEIPTKDHMKQRLDLFELTALSGDGDGAGGAPIVWLQVSQDYGETWGYERQRTLGVIGLRKARARWRRLGSGRNTVLRVATNMPQRVSWVKGIVKGEPLDT